jgi:acetyl esterase/lipase
MSRALETHVPPGVAARLDLRYDPGDDDARLDVFYPSAVEGRDTSLTTVVWVHGGGWVSGSKEEVANYLRILAGRGFTTLGVDYSIAPEKQYPVPLRQVSRALEYVVKHGTELHANTAHLVLAGDSGGALIAAQVANALADSSYARAVGIAPSIDPIRVTGVLLYCGGYDVERLRLEGPFGGFLKTVLWSYTGIRDFQGDARIATLSVVRFLSSRFPPAFLSAGNADPLMPQSRAMAESLAARSVALDTLFFSPDHRPALSHEYQFDLDSSAGRLALDRSVEFLARR